MLSDLDLDIAAGIAILHLIGFFAASLTALSLFPRLIHTLKTKKESGISWHYHLFMAIALFFWALYGIYSNDIPLAAANAIGMFELALLMFWKSKYG